MRAICLFLFSVVCVSPVLAEAGGITVSDPYFTATFAQATSAAGYGSFHNTGKSPRTLTGVKVPSSVATRASFHQTTIEDEMTSMKALSQVTIAAGETVSFAPGGRHIMLTGLVKPLHSGQTVVLELVYEDGTVQPVTFAVQQGHASMAHGHENH